MNCLECGRELKAIQTSHFKGSCTGHLESLAEYRSKYPTAPIRSDETRKKLAHSLESFVRRYGEVNGPNKWAEYCKKLSAKNSLEAFLIKGKTEEDWRTYNSSRAVTLKNLTVKYGKVDGRIKFEAYREKQKTAGNTLEYFVAKYGHEEGPVRYSQVCKSKGITLENMIRIHGRDLGFEKFNSWLEKTNGNYISLIASQFVKDIVELLPNDYIFHDGIFGKEFCIWDKDSVKMYDFVITSPVKKVVEFNGDYWHANPKIYNSESTVPIRGAPMSAIEIWRKDAIKLDIIKKKGFDVLVIWESDYRKNPTETINEVVTWITN